MELVYKISYHRMQDHYLPKLVQAIRLVSEEDLWKQEYLCEFNWWNRTTYL